MISLGAYDMVAISINSIASGYLWLSGANYCTDPTTIYALGCLGVGFWCGACLNCFVLVINRLLEVSNKHWLHMIYGGNRTYIVLLLPFIYSVYFCFFTPPVLFNSDHMAWFFFTYAPGYDSNQYYSVPHTINNLLVVMITCLLYVPYSRVLLSLSKSATRLSWAQKSVFQQSFTLFSTELSKEKL
ncbi:unnamed protein product [Cylicocyclus nassatus]|uniref:Uncharacterized protein n=1 Tax=Cylicocyclus nassatus TaxID=53992 RepID=A0AA36H7A6_CYLNA|nr:unnamed protein product [Cylicocyclus nassatus]